MISILLSFKSTGLSIQEKLKIHFQNGDHPGFPIRTLLAIFCLQVTLILPIKFKSTGFSVQKFKIDFQNGSCDGHLVFLIGMILAIFIYKSPQYFLPCFESIGLSVQKFKVDFQDGCPGDFQSE